MKSKQPVKAVVLKEKPLKEFEISDSLALVISCSEYYQCIYEPVDQSVKFKRESPIINL